MSDLNNLKQRIDAAISCAEYLRQHGKYGEAGYENAANHAAQMLLKVAARDPQAFKAALDSFRQNPYGNDIDSLMTAGERDLLFQGKFGLSGFQWGWAVNAVAHLLEQKAVPNPAIVTLGVRAAEPSGGEGVFDGD